MMSRFLFLSLLVYALLLSGLVSMNGALLALALPLLVYLLAALLYGPHNLQLRASRTLSADRVQDGTPVVVQVTITNEGGRLEEVLIQDCLPEQPSVIEGGTTTLVSLPAGGSADLTYTLIARRGSFYFDDLRVTASDRFGLFGRWAQISAPANLLVLPATLRLRQVAIRPRRTRGYAGPIPARVGGSGTDFFGVREYQAGDPQRWINWRVTARHPRSLFTNEFEQERIADVGLILDARRRTDVRVNGDSLFEHAVRATASLAEAFLSDGNRVGLLVYGWILDWTFPGYGKVQRERILCALARSRTGDSYVFDRLDYLPTGYFPAQSQLVLVSPLCYDDLPTLLRLRARGYELLVVRPDPVSLEVKWLGAQPGVELAARIVRVQRALLLRELHQAGIRVVDWQVDRPLDQVVHASLGRVPQWMRSGGVGRWPS